MRAPRGASWVVAMIRIRVMAGNMTPEEAVEKT